MGRPSWRVALWRWMSENIRTGHAASIGWCRRCRRNVGFAGIACVVEWRCQRHVLATRPSNLACHDPPARLPQPIPRRIRSSRWRTRRNRVDRRVSRAACWQSDEPDSLRHASTDPGGGEFARRHAELHVDRITVLKSSGRHLARGARRIAVGSFQQRAVGEFARGRRLECYRRWAACSRRDGGTQSSGELDGDKGDFQYDHR